MGNPVRLIQCVLLLHTSLSGMVCGHGVHNTQDSDNLSEAQPEMTSLVCLATVEGHVPALTLNHTEHGLIPIPESSLTTLSPRQVLLIIRGNRPILSDLMHTLQFGGAPVKTAFSTLMNSLDSIQRQCYLSPARDRKSIGNILEMERLPHSDDNLIFTDKSLTAIYMNNKNTIAISNTDQYEAALGLQQLGIEKNSTYLWFGTHYSPENLDRIPNEAFDNYLQSSLPSATLCSKESQLNTLNASYRCGSSEKKIDKTEGVHLSYEDPHHEATEAILWSSVAFTILIAILLPIAIFIAL